MRKMEEILEDRNQILVSGHRGIKAIYPENTLLSFQMALCEGVDSIEFDLNLTKDKQVVVIHDRTVDRTTNGVGYVNEYLLEDLKKLDAGSKKNIIFEGLKVPTLIELCELVRSYPELLLNVEIKENTYETVDLAFGILKKYDLFERCVFTCFDANILAYMVHTYGVKVQGFPKNNMINFVEGENGTYSLYYAVGIDMNTLTKEIVQEYEEMGILPWSYCPDDDEAVLKSLDCGARLVTVNNIYPALRIYREKGLHK